MGVSDSFAKVLAAGRAQFNQRVTEACRRFPAFDTAAFAGFLHSAVDPVVQAVAQVAPDRVASVALVAYELALELTGLTLAGPKARSTLVNCVWQELVPSYARLAAEHPIEVLGNLSNAAINIGKTANTRPEQWLREMVALAPRVATLPQLQIAGQLLAWRAGMAHLRIGAIQAAEQLPDALVFAAMGVAGNQTWAALRDALFANPWCMPGTAEGARSQPGTEIGQFTGFGGEFAEPPTVRACPEGFFVRSSDRYRFLLADAFGAVLHAATAEEFEHADNYQFPKAAHLNGARLMLAKRQVELNLPTDGLGVVCNAHTVAVTSPFTHAIRLLPLQ